MARALSRLQFDSPSFIAVGPTCRLLLKILATKDLRVLGNGTLKRAVLVHPDLPASSFNALASDTVPNNRNNRNNPNNP